MSYATSHYRQMVESQGAVYPMRLSNATEVVTSRSAVYPVRCSNTKGMVMSQGAAYPLRPYDTGRWGSRRERCIPCGSIIENQW